MRSVTGAKPLQVHRAPDIELIFAPFEWREQALQPPAAHGFSIGVGLIAPASRGSVSLVTRHVQVPPQIDFGLFTDSSGHDRKTMLAAVLLARKIAAQPPLNAHIEGVPRQHQWHRFDVVI